MFPGLIQGMGSFGGQMRMPGMGMGMQGMHGQQGRPKG